MSILLERITVPKILIPKKGIETANRIAKDFITFIEQVTETYNQNHDSALTPDQGMVLLMDSNITFQQLLDDPANADKINFVKKAIGLKWSGEKGFSKGYMVMNAKWAKWWLYNILTPYRPDLGKAIIEHPKGEQWIEDFVVGFRKLLWGK
jgi:hypothetical protein